MSYQIPEGIITVPQGGIEPNISYPIYSLAQGKFVALHKFKDGAVWVLYQHPHSGFWVTLRKAKTDDVLLFLNAGAMPERTIK